MFKKLFMPSQYFFWVLSGFLAFYFFYATAQGDLVHIPKLVFEGILILFALVFLILTHNFNFQDLKKDKPLFQIAMITLLYGIWITLTNTIFSSSPSYTLLGWTDWFSGYFLYLMCLFYFIIPMLSSRLENLVLGLNTLFWLSIITVFLCFLENIGFDVLLSNPLLQTLMHYRFNITSASFPVLAVGNSGYIGSLWLLFLPLPIVLISKNKSRQAIVWWVLLSTGIAATHSKISVIIAVIFFLSISFYLYKTKSIEKSHRTNLLISSFISIIIASFGNITMGQINSFLYTQRFVSRDAERAFDINRSFKDRLYIWQGALNAWKIRPMTGWGLETLPNTFFDHVPQSTLDYYGKIFAHKTDNESVRHFGNLLVIIPKYGKAKILRQVFTFNVKPHNYFIEELYSNGLVGLVLLVLFLTLTSRYCITSGSRESKLFLLGFGMYLIYLCGWFITIAVSPLAFILLGFAVHLAAKKRAEDRQALLNVEAPAMPDTA